MSLPDRSRPTPDQARPRVLRSARRYASAVASALALAALFHAGAAHADARTEARRHFKKGMQLVAAKQLNEGIRELEKAYELLPHPNVAFNIAQAQADAGNYDLAIRAYKTYAASDPPDKAEVLAIMQKLEEKLAAQRAAAVAEKAGGAKPATDQPATPAVDAGQKPAGSDAGGQPGSTAGAGPAATPGVPNAPTKTAAQLAAENERERLETQKLVGQARTEDIYQETIVTASRNAQSPLDAPNSTTIITRQDIRLSGITRIPELLRRVAGMDVMQITGGDSNVSMRGFNSRLGNKLLVLVNGRSVYNDILGSTFWETLTVDVDQVERIEVVRGPGSALYGANAFAGVVNIITIAPGEGKAGFRVGYGDHNTAYGSGWAAGREGDFAYRASVGYTRYPRWTREVANDRVDIHRPDFDPNLGAENLRVDLRTATRLGKDMELDAGGGFARVATNVYGIGPFNDYRFTGNVADVGLDFKSPHVNARTYYTRMDVRAGHNYAYRGQSLYESNPRQNVFHAEVEYTHSFDLPKPVRHDIHVGVAYRLKNINWEYLIDDVPIEHHGALYAQDTLHFGNKVNLVVSGRLDYQPYLKRVIGSPRGSLIIKPTDRQAVRLSGSTAFRSPTFLEAYLDLPIQLPLTGVELLSSSSRPDLGGQQKTQPEQITTVEASYLNQQSDYFEFEVTAYYNHVSNLVALAVNQNQTLSDVQAGLGGYNPETGRYTASFGGWTNIPDTYHVGGGEVGVRVYPVEGLDLFANYALNISKQQRAAGSTVPEDQRTSMHKVNAGIQVRTRPGINGEVTFHYQSSQKWQEQVATLDRGIVYKEFDLPAYTLVNARLGWRFYKERAEISGTVFNALAGVFDDAPQMHPFGNRVDRRFMGFFQYSL